MKKPSYSLIFRIAVIFHNNKTNTSKQINTVQNKLNEDNFSFGLDTHFWEKQKYTDRIGYSMMSHEKLYCKM